MEEVDINGVNTYRYWADNTELDNGKYNPENKCFCSDDVCLPAGGINVSACKFGKNYSLHFLSSSIVNSKL